VGHIQSCLRQTGLRLNDLHCPTGKDKRWGSPVEYQRLAGVELVKNRIEVAAELGTDVVVMHTPLEPAEGPERAAYWLRQRRTMDVLCPQAKKHGVRLALENTLPGNFETLEKFLALGGPDVLGLCYDSGHGNARVDWPGNGLDWLQRLRDRVIDLHLHDNDMSDDGHMMLFEGTVDWARLALLIPRTAYGKPVIPIEAGLPQGETGEEAERAFLRRVAAAGRRLAEMIETAR
jgi:sugar phosphate isomerase/epimerase